MLVRVFPWQTDSAFTPPQQPRSLRPRNVGARSAPRTRCLYNLMVSGGHIQVSEGDNRADVDPQTLQLSNVQTASAH